VFLVLSSIILSLLIATDFKVYDRREDFALLADVSEKVKIVDKIVNIPPFNRTPAEAKKLGKEYGWVGFNITLPHQNYTGYQAYGIIISHPSLTDPADIVMGVVNETDLELLKFDGFSEQAWNASKVYATASLDNTKLYQKFWFHDLDNAEKYCILFRGRKNSTEDDVIMISIKEAWYEARTLVPASPLSIGTNSFLMLSGALLIIKSFHRKKRKLRKNKR